VLCHSILRQASGPVSFIPVNKKNIPEFDRGIEDGSTEFSFSRFLTPYLCGYQGQSIFMDCDMLVRGDIYDVLSHCDLFHDVFVVKHDYIPKTDKKFLGNVQSSYPKKNWSSFMVFNNFMSACKKLSPERVSIESGAYLHQFKWTTEDRVGSLPIEWNHLVGEYCKRPTARVIHYTLGTPCFNGYQHQDWADEWFEERELMLHADQ
jgi:lipopolysaccharide biosynthesis glycosyltransferase